MKRSAQVSAVKWAGFALLALLSSGSGVGGEPTKPEDAAVELPPLIVAETTRLRPWRFVAGDGLEVLSQCDDSLTRDWMERNHRLVDLLREILPDDLQFRTTTPRTIILVDASAAPALSATLVQEFASSQRTDRLPEEWARPTGIRMVPNLELGDVDALTSFAIVDPKTFDADHLGYAPDHLRMLLRLRTPALPSWLRDGYNRVFAELGFGRSSLLLPPIVWRNQVESLRVHEDIDAAREMMPASQFFNEAERRTAPSERAWLYPAQAQLFVRWCLESATRRAALWRFAASGSGSEETLRACFGFGYSEWRDILSDYLPTAVSRKVEIAPARFTKPPAFTIRDATPAEVGRLKGEWERLAARYVRMRQPRYAPQYIELARRTLMIAEDRAGSDPGLQMVRGLLELDLGDRLAARPYLEAAAAGARCRPRVYVELAAYRLADALASGLAESGHVTPAQADIVREELAKANAQLPRLAESEALAAEVSIRLAKPAGPAELAQLDAAVARFPDYVPLLYFAAVLHVRNGDTRAAITLLQRGADAAPTPEIRTQFLQLRERLLAPRDRGPVDVLEASPPSVSP